ncbi:hypothetical protein Hanom_Chr04g00319381 [Helianthus anomalus]
MIKHTRYHHPQVKSRRRPNGRNRFMISSNPLRPFDENRNRKQVNEREDCNPPIQIQPVNLLKVLQTLFRVNVSQHEPDVTDHSPP